MQDFLKKMEVGSLELEKGLKRWVSGAKMWPEKRGLEGSTSRITFQCEYPPSPYNCMPQTFQLQVTEYLKQNMPGVKNLEHCAIHPRPKSTDYYRLVSWSSLVFQSLINQNKQWSKYLWSPPSKSTTFTDLFLSLSHSLTLILRQAVMLFPQTLTLH